MGKQRRKAKGPKQWAKITDQRIINMATEWWPEQPLEGPFLYIKLGLRVMVTVEREHGVHLSISHLGRQPTWDEQKDARYSLCPNVPYMASILPPKDEYVDFHPHTFHWWEYK